MKKIFFSLFLFISIIAIGQNSSIEKPPKKTWKILIKNNNNKDTNFKLVGQIIVDNDFSIEKKDSDYLTLKTSPKVTDGKTSTYYLNLISKDSLIVLTGMAKSRINVQFANVEEEYSKIQNIGMKGSIAKDQFDSMFNFAKLFNSDIEFITE